MSSTLYNSSNVHRRPLTPPNDDAKNSVITDKQDTVPTGFSKAEGVNDQTTFNAAESTDMERNDVTRRIEKEVLRLLQWENPIRSGVVLLLIVSSLFLTQRYSLLQIGSAILAVVTGINLVYVTFMMQTQRVFSESTNPVHPYRGVIENRGQLAAVDKQAARHYTNLLIDICETVIRATARIVFIENAVTSLKWFGISYLTWTLSAHVSCRMIALLFTVSAFVFPRLYFSNKGIVDAHLNQSEAVIKDTIKTAQNKTAESVNSIYSKARAYAAQTGTSGTDAKNSLQNTSVTLKKTE